MLKVKHNLFSLLKVGRCEKKELHFLQLNNEQEISYFSRER